MSEKRNGPVVTVNASCRGCVYSHSEYYCVEDGNDVDSGFTHYCGNDRAVSAAQRASNGLRRVGDTSTTPQWCPLLGPAMLALGTQLTAIHPLDADEAAMCEGLGSGARMNEELQAMADGIKAALAMLQDVDPDRIDVRVCNIPDPSLPVGKIRTVVSVDLDGKTPPEDWQAVIAGLIATVLDLGTALHGEPVGAIVSAGVS